MGFLNKIYVRLLMICPSEKGIDIWGHALIWPGENEQDKTNVLI